MMVRITKACLIIVCSFAVNSFGQALQKIDSLKTILSSYSDRDTIRVNLLNSIGFVYWTIDASRSATFGNEALVLAEQLEYSKGMAMANRVIGVSHWSRGNYLQALTFLLRSREIYTALSNRLGEANATMNIGMVYADQADHQRALEHYFEALKIFQSLPNCEERIGTLFTKIGAVYNDQKEYDQAYEYFVKSLDIHQSIKYAFGVQEANNFLGIMYSEEGSFSEAESYFERSLKIAEQRKDSEHIAKNLENLASLYLKRGDLKTAETYLLRAYQLSKLHGNKKILYSTLTHLREIALAKNDFRSAINYFREHEVIKDSLFNQEKSIQISNLVQQWEEKEVERNAQLREQEFKLLQQERQSERIISIALAVALALLLTIGYLLFRSQKYRIKKNHELLISSRILHKSQQQLAEKELENTKLKEKDLRLALDQKNRELASYALNFIQKTELLEGIQMKVRNIRSKVNGEVATDMNSLLSQIQQQQNFDRNWLDFKRTFEEVHPNFFNQLVSRFPDLSPSELRHCSLVKLNLGTNETASLLGISADSLKTSRYRLKKKLNLAQDQRLEEFLIPFH